jgi:hypothetical protein
MPATPLAHGVVRRRDGQSIPPGYAYVIKFQNNFGAVVMSQHDPAFTLCVRRQDLNNGYYWTAEIRADEKGPVLFRTRKPQAFKPKVPMVILVDPVS